MLYHGIKTRKREERGETERKISEVDIYMMHADSINKKWLMLSMTLLQSSMSCVHLNKIELIRNEWLQKTIEWRRERKRGVSNSDDIVDR